MKYFLNDEEAERFRTKNILAAATVADEKGCQNWLILKFLTSKPCFQHRQGQRRVLAYSQNTGPGCCTSQGWKSLGMSGLLLGKEGEGKPSVFLFGGGEFSHSPFAFTRNLLLHIHADARASADTRAGEGRLPCTCVLANTT